MSPAWGYTTPLTSLKFGPDFQLSQQAFATTPQRAGPGLSGLWKLGGRLVQASQLGCSPKRLDLQLGMP